MSASRTPVPALDRPLRVLVLEDRPEDAELALDALGEAGFTLDARVVASEAEYLARLDPTLDVILADYQLPGFDALGALRHLQARGLDVPLVVLTGSANEEVAVRCMREGAADYLLKDRLARLGPAVRRALEERGLRQARRWDEAARRESEARHRLITESVNDAIVLAGLDGRILFATGRVRELFGYAPDELVGRSVASLLTSEGARVVEARLAAVRAGQEVAPTVEVEVLRRDGTPVWVEAGVTSFLEDGRVAGRLAVIRDVAERRQAQEALRLSEARFRSVFQDAAIGMAVQGLDGRCLRVNPSLCRMLGYAETELLGLSYHAVTHPDDHARDVEHDRRMLAGEISSYQVEKRYLHKEGHAVWTLATVSLVRAADGDPLHFITQAVDLTGRRRAEEARQGLEAQLRQAQKMEAVGRLAGGVAHDFNNVLTVMLGHAELLRSRLPAGDAARRHLDLIDQAGTRAAAVVRQLLTFSRKEAVRPVVLDPNLAVVAMEKLLRRLIGEDVALTTRLHPGAGRVRVDPGQLEQVLLNLAVNARDAMPGGGRLVLSTGRADVDEAAARRHPDARPGPHVTVAVTDTGVGMDEATKARLFEPFFTTKAPGKGTGLGLATVYGIVTQAGGWVDVDSAPGRGATFTVHLPRVEAAAEEPTPDPVLGASRGGTETILLAEDEESLGRLVRTVLEHRGYTVIEARTGGQALGLGARHPGPIHLLLTDVVMPGMSGAALAAMLRPVRPELSVLYMSGYTDDAIQPHGVLERGVHFIAKPFTPDTLARKVREVLDLVPGDPPPADRPPGP